MKNTISLLLILTISQIVISQDITINGELKLWHKIELTLNGPSLSEEASTFTDYRMDVTFTHTASGETFVVPGFFAADGDAANSSAVSGNKWKAYLRPNKIGEWSYTIDFYNNPNVAISNTPNGKVDIYSRLIYIYELSSITKEIIKQDESVF